MTMTTMTLAVPEELKQRMDHFPEMNWSQVARQAFADKIEDLELLMKFKAKSTITEEDAARLGKEVGRALTKRMKERTA